MKATDRIKYCQRIEQLIHRLGGSHVPNDLGRMQLLTPLGKLYITVEPENRHGDGSLRKVFNIFCRWDDTERIHRMADWNSEAASLRYAMCKTGKWNFHLFSGEVAENIEFIERKLEAVMNSPMTKAA